MTAKAAEDATHPVSAARLQDLVDKQQITEILHLYARGIDRHDRAALMRCYWPDAHADHIGYVGPIAGFTDYALAATAAMRTSHIISNILITRTDASTACSEAHYLAYHDIPGGHGNTDVIMAGRYLDRFEKRGESWRIAARTVTADFNATAPGTAVWGPPFLPNLRTKGGRFPDDPLYRCFGPNISERL